MWIVCAVLQLGLGSHADGSRVSFLKRRRAFKRLYMYVHVKMKNSCDFNNALEFDLLLKVYGREGIGKIIRNYVIVCFVYIMTFS